MGKKSIKSMLDVDHFGIKSCETTPELFKESIFNFILNENMMHISGENEAITLFEENIYPPGTEKNKDFIITLGPMIKKGAMKMGVFALAKLTDYFKEYAKKHKRISKKDKKKYRMIGKLISNWDDIVAIRCQIIENNKLLLRFNHSGKSRLKLTTELINHVFSNELVNK